MVLACVNHVLMEPWPQAKELPNVLLVTVVPQRILLIPIVLLVLRDSFPTTQDLVYCVPQTATPMLMDRANATCVLMDTRLMLAKLIVVLVQPEVILKAALLVLHVLQDPIRSVMDLRYVCRVVVEVNRMEQELVVWLVLMDSSRLMTDHVILVHPTNSHAQEPVNVRTVDLVTNQTLLKMDAILVLQGLIRLVEECV